VDFSYAGDLTGSWNLELDAGGRANDRLDAPMALAYVVKRILSPCGAKGKLCCEV